MTQPALTPIQIIRQAFHGQVVHSLEELIVALREGRNPSHSILFLQHYEQVFRSQASVRAFFDALPNQDYRNVRDYLAGVWQQDPPEPLVTPEMRAFLDALGAHILKNSA